MKSPIKFKQKPLAYGKQADMPVASQNLVSLEEASRLLRAGELVAIPTETVYGLAADATNPLAVAKIFALKGRPTHHPLIVHLPDLGWIEKVAVEIPESLPSLSSLWPGPLTIILKKHPDLSLAVTGGKNTVAIRFPNHPLAMALLREVGRPLAAPSANRFGSVSSTSAEHVLQEFGSDLAVLDGGECEVGLESSIVDLSCSPPRLLRQGGISYSILKQYLPALELADPNAKAIAPGMLARHYSPKTPFFLVSSLEEAPPGVDVGLLVFTPISNPEKYANVEVLSTSGDFSEAGKNLYAAMRRLDKQKLSKIIAIKLPAENLGMAINDRLTRAACQE